MAEYLKDGNGKRAATVAGWSAKTAESRASQVLRNVKVQALLEAGRKKIEAKTGVTVEEIVENAREVFSRSTQGQPVMVFDPVEKCMVQATEEVVNPNTGEVEERGVWKFDSAGANKANELLGKTIGAFKEVGELLHKSPPEIVYRPFPQKKKGKRAA